MADYSSYFDFGSGPALENARSFVVQGGIGSVSMGNVDFQRVTDGRKNNKADSAFNALMAGHDATSAQYTAKLNSLYDAYGKYAKDYGDKAQPIIDALTGDIKDMQGYVKDYGNTLGEIKDTMMNGINVDPNASRTKEEYQGNLAAAYGKQREQQIQNMQSQGLNPYSNQGADRQASLQFAAGSTDVANKAYDDWRKGYNADMQAKQRGQAMYAGLQSKQGELQGQVMQGRGGLLNATKSIYDANMTSGQAQQSVTTDLMSQENSRRAEALALGQQQQANARTNADLKQQMQAKLSPMALALGSGQTDFIY